jgi:hypothetical protein
MKAHKNFDDPAQAGFWLETWLLEIAPLTDAFEKRQHPSAATGPLD